MDGRLRRITWSWELHLCLKTATKGKMRAPELKGTQRLLNSQRLADLSKRPNELLPTRRSLLSRLKNCDDSQSWKDFFDSYWELIYGVAIKTGLSDAEAQDVVQETIITVANKIGEFRYDPARSFKGWLLNTARWKITDQFRKRIPRHDHAPRADDTTRTSTIGRLPDPRSLDLDALWDQEWKSHIQEIALERIKQKVNPKHYQIFDYYVLRQWPVEKVTSALRISEDQVYQGKTRILRQLKAEISRLEAKNI